MNPSITIGAVARRVNGILEGDPSVVITGLNSLQEAGPGDITFLANPKYAAQIAQTRASAVLVGKDWKGTAPCAVVRTDNPDLSFSMIAEWVVPPVPRPAPGIHPTAVVAADVRLGVAVSVGPYCVLEPGVVVGDRTVIQAGCTVGRDSTIGPDGWVYPRVTIRERVRIGARIMAHSGTVIGSDGFGYARQGDAWIKIPQVGIVEIGDDVELGANVTIDRARFGRTVVGNGVKIDNLVQVGHNVRIGDHCAMAAQVGLSGTTIVGKGVRIGGQAGFAGHLTVGDNAIIGAKAGIPKDVPANTFMSGYPAVPHEKWLEAHAHIMRLPRLKERVAELEQRLAMLESRLSSGDAKKG